VRIWWVISLCTWDVSFFCSLACLWSCFCSTGQWGRKSKDMPFDVRGRGLIDHGENGIIISFSSIVFVFLFDGYIGFSSNSNRFQKTNTIYGRHNKIHVHGMAYHQIGWLLRCVEWPSLFWLFVYMYSRSAYCSSSGYIMIEGASQLCIHLVLLEFTCAGFKDGRSRKMHLAI